MGRLRWDEKIVTGGSIQYFYSSSTSNPIWSFQKIIRRKLFCQPMKSKSKSGIDLKNWAEITILMYQKIGTTNGPFFRITMQGKMKQATTFDLDVLFHKSLPQVQKLYYCIILGTVNVEDECSMYRSDRRGSMVEAQNVKVPKEVIEANNCLRKHKSARGLTPGMSIMDKYSEVKVSVHILVRYSESL